MLRNIWVEQTLFSPRDDVKESRRDLCYWLEALCFRNADYLKQRPETPRLYKSGVVWEAPKQFDGDCEEVMVLKRALGKMAKERDVQKVLEKIQGVLGGEHFCDIGVILELGKIDCDGVACWRVAELRQMGIKASPYMTHRDRWGGGTTYHALVLWPPFGDSPYPTTEDPSLLLGMHQPARASDRAEEIRKNVERFDWIRRHGLTVANGAAAPASALEDVLGLRRRPAAGGIDAGALADIEKLLRAA
jgi:hypothetical protein